MTSPTPSPVLTLLFQLICLLFRHLHLSTFYPPLSFFFLHTPHICFSTADETSLRAPPVAFLQHRSSIFTASRTRAQSFSSPAMPPAPNPNAPLQERLLTLAKTLQCTWSLPQRSHPTMLHESLDSRVSSGPLPLPRALPRV